MASINNSMRYWIALAVWGAGIALFLILGWWNVTSFRRDAENRLISDAGRTAAQIAGILSLPGTSFNEGSAKAIVMAAMEDENIYAIKIATRDGLLAGQRRNYMWEPVNWDDEIAENCVQGINPVRVSGRTEGMVEVWLSPRLNAEEAGLLEKREFWRFLLIFFLWTTALALLFWHWGEFRRWRETWAKDHPGHAKKSPEDVILGAGEITSQNADGAPFVDSKAAHEFQCNNQESWLITTGMFKQTFGRAPELISRLYAKGDIAPLCHLGHVLEQAAPFIGAAPLAEAAARMQAALNDPSCATPATHVENCVSVLDQTLSELNGRRKAGR